jgi:hypothetical protein
LAILASFATGGEGEEDVETGRRGDAERGREESRSNYFPIFIIFITFPTFPIFPTFIIIPRVAASPRRRVLFPVD